MPLLKNAQPKPTINWYMGIDPGSDGGIAMTDGKTLRTHKLKELTEREIWQVVLSANFTAPACDSKLTAIIEAQVPRPTRYPDRSRPGKFVSSILKSTCVLYAHYFQIRMALIAAEIPFEEVTPQRWQRTMMLGGKHKGESKSKWKNRCKAKAQQLFPSEKITLPIADAVLIADYCRRRAIAGGD